MSERKTRFATITVTEGTREAVRRMRYRLATEERVPTLAETVEMVFERYTKILDESKETSNACDQN